MSWTHPDEEHRQDLLDEAAYLELLSRPATCCGCGVDCCDDPFTVEGETYCDPCAAALCVLAAGGTRWGTAVRQ